MAQQKERIRKVTALDSRRAPRAFVHREEIISAQILPFRLRGQDEGRPMLIGDAAALPPLLDGLVLLPDIESQSRQVVVPPIEDNFQGKGLHVPEYEGDNYSRQSVPMIPVTASRHHRTICPMGRGTSPTRFRKELAERLKSARIAARYATQQEFANALHVPLERYKKWESGRTNMPHQYIPLACELTGQDANYFFSVTPVTLKKIA